jgi:hypothetical protein
MAGNDGDRGRSRRLDVEDRGWLSKGRALDGDEDHGFLGVASKPRSTVSPGLASKPMATILVVWLQNHLLGFPSLSLKISSCSVVIWPTKSP